MTTRVGHGKLSRTNPQEYPAQYRVITKTPVPRAGGTRVKQALAVRAAKIRKIGMAAVASVSRKFCPGGAPGSKFMQLDSERVAGEVGVDCEGRREIPRLMEFLVDFFVGQNAAPPKRIA